MYTLIICLILLITVIILILWVFDFDEERFMICFLTFFVLALFFVIMSAIFSPPTKKYVSTYQLEKIENTYVLETEHSYIVKIKNRPYDIKKGDVEIIFANENKLVRIDKIPRSYKISWGFTFSYTSYKLYIKL
jgi:membrane protein YdbS with pleckstrin-like domain